MSDLPPPASRKRAADHQLDPRDLDKIEKDQVVGEKSEKVEKAPEGELNKRPIALAKRRKQTEVSTPSTDPSAAPKPESGSWDNIEPKFGSTGTFAFTNSWLKTPGTLPSFLQKKEGEGEEKKLFSFQPIAFPKKTESEGTNSQTDDRNESTDLDGGPILTQPLTSGEEGDTILFNEESKLFQYFTEDKSWKERGLVSFQINSYKLSDRDSTRIIIRDGIGRVLVNYRITKTFTVNINEKQPTGIKFVASFSENSSTPIVFGARFRSSELAAKAQKIFVESLEKISKDEENGNKESESLEKISKDEENGNKESKNDEDKSEINQTEGKDHEEKSQLENSKCETDKNETEAK